MKTHHINPLFVIITLITLFSLTISHLQAQDPNRVGFGGIGSVGDHYTAREAIFINPARIAAGAKAYGQVSYSFYRIPFSFLEDADIQSRVVNGGYAWDSGHAIGVASSGFGLNQLSTSPKPNLRKGAIAVGYRYRSKKALSFGLALKYGSEIRPDQKFPDQIVDGEFVPGDVGDITLRGLTVGLGMHKSWISRQEASGFNQFELGASLADLGGRQLVRLNDDPLGTGRYPGSMLRLGFSYKRHIAFSDERTFINVIVAYEASKDLTPFYEFGEIPASTFLGAIFDSFTDESLWNELGGIDHAFGLRAHGNYHDFGFGLSAGIVPSVSLINYYGAEFSYKNLAIRGAWVDYQGFANIPGYRTPSFALDWHIPIKH
ncbi:MAG: hypothetical protein AB8F95_21530 [Bacteroidia bacterium]